MQTADFTIADVLAWARTKPAGERYDFTDSDNCAVAQFGLATGRPNLVGLLSRQLEALTSFEFLVALTSASTFGALADRLVKLLPAEPLSDTWTRAGAYCHDLEILVREFAA